MTWSTGIRTLVSGWRYGSPVVVVSGLPRSGTSLLMSMLQAGGLSLLTDACRPADDDNPQGYFEFDAVKALGAGGDKSWVRQARGRGIKVISHLLKELPADNFYQVVLATRDLSEILASQNRMLRNREVVNPVNDARALDLYRKHLVNVRTFLRLRPNFSSLEIGYRQTIESPADTVAALAAFLGPSLNPQRMAGVVNERLYRNRQSELTGKP